MARIVQDFLNSPVSQVARMRNIPVTGDLFGLELECEGRNVGSGPDPDNFTKGWELHADGSLRNNHGSSGEWVFKGPVTLKTAVGQVNNLFKFFDKQRAGLVTSNRTSTHVHFNIGDKNVYQVFNIFILFTILEGILDTFCGEDRNGNLFCLSSRHAEAQLKWVEYCLKDCSLSFREEGRYCSLNLASINKFGTVEFRGMRGLDNAQDVVDWLNIVNELCEFACYKMQNPMTLVQDISIKTPVNFLRDVFSENSFNKLTAGLTENEISNSVYEGLRLVQMLCYIIGNEFDGVRLKGRDFWAGLVENKAEENVVLEQQNEPAIQNPIRVLERARQHANRLALNARHQDIHFIREGEIIVAGDWNNNGF